MLGRFIKTELFRLSKMKSVILIPIILTLILLFQNFFLLGFNVDALLFYGFDEGQQVTDTSGTEDLESGYDVFGRTLPEDEQPVNEEKSKELSEKSGKIFGGIGRGYFFNVSQTYQSGIQGEIPLLLIAIVAALFFGNDYSTHFSKNYSLINGRRWISAVAQFVVIGIFTFFIHILAWIVSFFSNLFWADSINPGIDLKSLGYFIFSYAATMSIVSLILLVATMLKSKAAAIVFSILSSLGVVSSPVAILDIILRMNFDLGEFSLNYILPTRILALVGSTSSGKIVLLASVCVIIYLTSSILGSILLLRKRDMST